MYDSFFFGGFESVWTDWLYREWQEANLYYRLHLSRPVIKIAEMKGNHGKWDSYTRTITVSSGTIRKYPWHQVVNILRHEMAHQIVDESGNGREKSHGVSFQTACKKMGLPDWACAASGELPDEIPDWRSSTLTADEQRLLDRANKLLALGSSDNEHEASLAMQRVRELYAKYNLEQVEQRKEARFVSWVLNTRQRRMDAWDSIILSILNEHFFVRVIHLNVYDAEDCDRFAGAEIMGKPENLKMAEYVYNFLKKTLDTLWEKHVETLPPMNGTKFRTERRNYFLGVLRGFELELEKTREASFRRPNLTESDSRALVVAIEKELDQFFRTRYPRTSTTGGTRVNTGSESYQQGKTDGSKIRFSRPLTGHEGNRGYLLTS